MTLRVTEAQMRTLLAPKSPHISSGRTQGRGRVVGQVYASKLEERYAGVLEQRRLAGDVHQWWYEPFGIKLSSNRNYYHPDFLVQRADGYLECHETKGFIRDGALEKLKVAATKYPCFVFRLVFWRNKQWVIEEVTP